MAHIAENTYITKSTHLLHRLRIFIKSPQWCIFMTLHTCMDNEQSHSYCYICIIFFFLSNYRQFISSSLLSYSFIDRLFCLIKLHILHNLCTILKMALIALLMLLILVATLLCIHVNSFILVSYYLLIVIFDMIKSYFYIS